MFDFGYNKHEYSSTTPLQPDGSGNLEGGGNNLEAGEVRFLQATADRQ
jgi:hypothetical protein